MTDLDELTNTIAHELLTGKRAGKKICRYLLGVLVEEKDEEIAELREQLIRQQRQMAELRGEIVSKSRGHTRKLQDAEQAAQERREGME